MLIFNEISKDIYSMQAKIQSNDHKEIRLAILFSGNGSNLENLVNHQSAMQNELSAQGINAHFVLAISNNKNAYGIERCARLGLRCEVIEHRDFATRLEFENALSDALARNRIDIVVLAGFMRILGAKIVQDFTFINIHPSFLPLHKGAHAIKDSFEGAEDFGGVSVHWVSEELDSGAIIAQEKVYKQSGENLESFEKRIHELEYKLYPKALICAIKEYAKNLDEK